MYQLQESDEHSFVRNLWRLQHSRELRWTWTVHDQWSDAQLSIKCLILTANFSSALMCMCQSETHLQSDAAVIQQGAAEMMVSLCSGSLLVPVSMWLFHRWSVMLRWRVDLTMSCYLPPSLLLPTISKEMIDGTLQTFSVILPISSCNYGRSIKFHLKLLSVSTFIG